MAGHFDKNASQWDDPGRTKMANEIWKSMSSRLDLSPDFQGMDVGAGTGLITFSLAKKVKFVIAVDNSREMLCVLREKSETMGFVNVSTESLDLDTDKLPMGPFHVVVSSMTLHHIKDTERFIKMLSEVVISGGMVAIADLEKEDGHFHKDAVEAGVRHFGFERTLLSGLLEKYEFKDILFEVAFNVIRSTDSGGEKTYPVFCMTARKS